MPANYTKAAMVPLVIAAFSLFGTIILNITLIKRWRGWWRIVAGLPLAIVVIWTSVIIVSIMLDPAAHNLWPLEIILWSASTLITLGLLALLRRIMKVK